MNHSILKNILILLLFIVLGVGIYSNTLGVPFLFDDKLRILDNQYIRTTTLSEIGKAGFKSSPSRPIVFASFALNYYFHQYDLKGYHVVNIIIHILTGFFFYILVQTTLRLPLLRHRYHQPVSITVFAALLWLVNPVHTQSVTYIVQRLNSMATMFYLLSLLLYVTGRTRQEGRVTQTAQIDKKAKQKEGAFTKHRNTASDSRFSTPGLYFSGAALAWMLALGCKQTAATLPFFIFLYEWYFFQNLSKDWLKKHLKYLFWVCLLFSFVALIYLGLKPLEQIQSLKDYANKEFTFTERALTQARVVVYYLSLIFYPHPSRLNLDHDFPLSHSLIDPATTMFSLIGIVGLIGLAILIARKERLISFCVLWYFGNLVIESSVIPLAVIYEHRTYMPSMFICLMAVALFSRYIKPKWLTTGLLCAMVVICSVWTYERNHVWGDPVTFWKDCVEKSPKRLRSHYNLGNALENDHQTDEAIEHYRQAIRISPDYVKAHFNLGSTLASQDRIDEAINHFLETLRLEPDHVKAHNNLGNVLIKQGRLDDAIAHFQEVLKLKPDYSGTHNNLGIALFRKGNIKEAIFHFQEAVRITPDFVQAKNNLNSVLGSSEAIEHYLEMLRIKPDSEEAHYYLGNALIRQDRIDEAIEHYTEALRIKPDYEGAHNNLAIALFRNRDVEGAVVHFREVLRIHPYTVDAKNNLKTVLTILRKNQCP